MRAGKSCGLRAHCGDPDFPSALSDLRFSFVTIHFGSSENNSQSTTLHGSGACVTESMSAIDGSCDVRYTQQRADELSAHMGELAAQWQQVMGTLQRVEQEAVSSQRLANAIESIGRTRTEATAVRLRPKDGERLYPKSWSGSTPLGGSRLESCSSGSRRERSERRRRGLTVAMLKTTSMSSLANATEGAARAAVLRITQTEPSHGFVAWQALVDGYAPKSSNHPGDSAAAHTCDAQEVQGRDGAERKAHSVVTEGDRVRASIQNDR